MSNEDNFILKEELIDNTLEIPLEAENSSVIVSQEFSIKSEEFEPEIVTYEIKEIPNDAEDQEMKELLVVKEDPDDIEIPEVCDICGKTFKTKNSLQSHICCSHRFESQIKKKSKKISDEPLQCSRCTFSCHNYTSFYIHVKRHEREEQEALEFAANNVKCEFCGTFYPLKKINSHMKSIHPKGTWNCHICKGEFATKILLKQHLKDHHPESAAMVLHLEEAEVQRIREEKLKMSREKKQMEEQKRIDKLQRIEQQKVEEEQRKRERIDRIERNRIARIQKAKEIEARKLEMNKRREEKWQESRERYRRRRLGKYWNEDESYSEEDSDDEIVTRSRTKKENGDEKKEVKVQEIKGKVEKKVEALKMCKVCRKSFRTTQALNLHISHTHEKSSKPKFSCKFCGFSTNHVRTLRNHKKKHELDQDPAYLVFVKMKEQEKIQKQERIARIKERKLERLAKIEMKQKKKLALLEKEREKMIEKMERTQKLMEERNNKEMRKSKRFAVKIKEEAESYFEEVQVEIKQEPEIEIDESVVKFEI